MPIERIELTEREAEFIRESVEGGAYHDASEVLRAGLHLLAERKDELQAALQAGLDDIAAGRYIELTSREAIDALGEEVCREGMARLAQESDDPPARSE